VRTPITQRASFSDAVVTREITIESAPPGLKINVDGQTYTSSHTFTWDVGSAHQIETNSPQTGSPGVRHVWNTWSNNQGMLHTYIVEAGPAMKLIAKFDPEFYLTTTAGVGGNVLPASNWHPSGTAIELSATPLAGYSFDHWEGSGTASYSGTDNPITVTITSPISEVAFFRQVSGVGDVSAGPLGVELRQNIPNPFSTSTSIEFVLSSRSEVTLLITDILGREVATLLHAAVLDAGRHALRFDAARLPAGLYCYRLQTGNTAVTRRMVLLR
jgi:hypothetical protein